MLLVENRSSQVPAESETLQKAVHGLVNVDPSSRPERYKELLTKLDSSADQLTAKDINQSRVEFGQLSADLIAFLREFPPKLEDPLYTIKCPMWNKSPSVWLQDSTDVKNPFLGPGMPTCGTVQETLRAER